jgi:hypothetical protein
MVNERLYTVTINYRVNGIGRVLTRTWVLTSFDEAEAVQECKDSLWRGMKKLKVTSDVQSISVSRIEGGMVEVKGEIIL